MAQPIWQTPAGNLGTIPEEVFYSVSLRAVDPENPLNPVRYRLISGELPGGIQLSANGTVEGTPNAKIIVQGVPFRIDQDLTSKFAIRAFTQKVVNGQPVVDRFVDQTFTITVAGQDIPAFVTPAGLIATFADAGPASVKIEFFDDDVGDDLTASLADGELPPGMTVGKDGTISGIIPPIATSNLYTFSIAVTDTKSSNLRSFSIQVNKSDQTKPFLTNALPSNLGTFRSDNFFAYQFKGFDFGEQTLEYVVVPGLGRELPPGTQLDSETGWLYGYFPELGLTENTYNFRIQVRERDTPSSISPEYDFSVKLIGLIDSQIEWITPENVGTIGNGEISTLKIEATNLANRSLQYRLAPGRYPIPDTGVYNKLPQGLELLPSGDIAGRVSFNTFSVDNGSTTFDKNSRTRFVRNETTFDMTFEFTANAYSSDGLISVFKNFVITVVRKYNEPFENLYIKAMPPQNDRDLINSLLQNSDIFPPKLMYRNEDLYFGVAKHVIYEHAFGLKTSTIEKYISSLYKNHYLKNLTIGSIETAQARDSNNNVIYEVVYSRIIGGMLNDLGQSVSKELTWPYPISIEGDPTPIDTVYPNSLINMRDQVNDVVGQVDTVLPLWMTSKQQDGRVLGFTPAWVIAYVKPGFGQQIAYNVRTQFGQELNKVDFKVDRYSLDRTLSKNWDPVAEMWVPVGAETTFDLVDHYRLIDDSTAPGGINYRVGDQILINGTQVGGLTPNNNIMLTVSEVDDLGGVIDAFCQGIAPLFSAGNTFTAVTGNNVQSGTGARFTIKRVNLAYFVEVSNDGGSGYTVGNQLVISGSVLGGANTVNDCLLEITNVGLNGEVLEFEINGLAAPGVGVYTNLNGTKIYGSGAQFDIVVHSNDPTIFDGNSLRFTAPVDNYTTSNQFDKYLVFPKRTILT
jgi:hypothetical protein